MGGADGRDTPMSNLAGHPLYITIPYPIFVDQKLTPTQKLILAEISSLLQIETAYCWASNQHFAKQLQVSIDSVTKAVQRLKATGYIQFVNYGLEPCPVDECPLHLKGNHRHIFPTPKLLPFKLTPLSAKNGEGIRTLRRGYPQKADVVHTGSTHKDKEAARFLELKGTPNKSDREVREYMELNRIINLRAHLRNQALAS